MGLPPLLATPLDSRSGGGYFLFGRLASRCFVVAARFFVFSRPSPAATSAALAVSSPVQSSFSPPPGDELYSPSYHGAAHSPFLPLWFGRIVAAVCRASVPVFEFSHPPSGHRQVCLRRYARLSWDSSKKTLVVSSRWVLRLFKPGLSFLSRFGAPISMPVHMPRGPLRLC